MSAWYVYLIECRDGSVYTGIAIDVDRRFAQHAAGKGARYTRAHPPLRLLARFAYPDRGAATRAEHAIKQLTAARKRALCDAAALVVEDSSDAKYEVVAERPGTAAANAMASRPTCLNDSS